MGREEKSLFSRPGSELRLGTEKVQRKSATKIDGGIIPRKKKKKKTFNNKKNDGERPKIRCALLFGLSIIELQNAISGLNTFD